MRRPWRTYKRRRSPSRRSSRSTGGAWLEETGNQRPHIYPNPITEEFEALEKTKERRTVLNELDKRLAACVISPMETLGVPRVSHDMEPDLRAHAQTVYESHVEGHNKTAELTRDPPGSPFPNHMRIDGAKKWFEENPTFEAWIDNNIGSFLSDAPGVADSPGMGKVTGMMVAPTSFRGKVIGYIGFLSDEVKGAAYEDKSPEGLIAYGKQILKECDQARGRGDIEMDDWKTAQAGGEWCVFWGEKGHGMWAWY